MKRSRSHFDTRALTEGDSLYKHRLLVKFTSTKFIICMLSLIMANLLLSIHRLDGATYAGLVLGLVAFYSGAQAVQNRALIKQNHADSQGESGDF